MPHIHSFSAHLLAILKDLRKVDVGDAGENLLPMRRCSTLTHQLIIPVQFPLPVFKFVTDLFSHFNEGLLWGEDASMLRNQPYPLGRLMVLETAATAIAQVARLAPFWYYRFPLSRQMAPLHQVFP